MTPYISLYGDSRFPHPQVFFAGQPAADGLLDADAGRAQFIRTQLLQVSHLTGSEEDLVFAQLILVLVLAAKQRTQYYTILLLVTFNIHIMGIIYSVDKPL